MAASSKFSAEIAHRACFCALAIETSSFLYTSAARFEDGCVDGTVAGDAGGGG